MTRVVLDAGAFVAFERGDVRLRGWLTAARRMDLELITSSPVVAQVWRDGRRQVLLARLLAATNVIRPDALAARRAGELCGRTGTTDVVDALLVDLARDGDSIFTSDRGDITRLLSAKGVRASVRAV